jgi:hypothetical protein
MCVLLYWRSCGSRKLRCWYYEQEVVVARLLFSEGSRGCDVGFVGKKSELRCCFVGKKGEPWCYCLEVGVAKLLMGKNRKTRTKVFLTHRKKISKIHVPSLFIFK